MARTGWRGGLSLQTSPETQPESRTAMSMIIGLFKLLRRFTRMREAMTDAHFKLSEAKQAAATLGSHEQFQAVWAPSAAVQHMESVTAGAQEVLGMPLQFMQASAHLCRVVLGHLHLPLNVIAPVSLPAYMQLVLAKGVHSQVWLAVVHKHQAKRSRLMLEHWHSRHRPTACTPKAGCSHKGELCCKYLMARHPWSLKYTAIVSDRHGLSNPIHARHVHAALFCCTYHPVLISQEIGGHGFLDMGSDNSMS